MAVECYSYNHTSKDKHVQDIVVEEEEEEEEDYIDMEVTSYAHFIANHTTFMPSPQHAREFEFHMSSSLNVKKQSTTSPADELFYKGKLLPLHLPPRLQMVEKLLQDSPRSLQFTKFNNNEVYSTPLGTNTATTPTSSSPFESCSVSPVESCQVSRELNPAEYFGGEYANVEEQQKMGYVNSSYGKKYSWTKKLKTKIKSLFGKSSGGSDELSANPSATKNKEECSSSRAKEDHNRVDKKGMKGNNKVPFGQIPSTVTREIFGKENGTQEENNVICHRRSFSGAFKRRSSSTTKVLSASSSSGSSSSSSTSSSTSSVGSACSSSSNGVSDVQPLKRSSSAKLEIETSLIQGAIAHCKQSQQAVLRSRKTLSEIGSHSFPTRFVAFDDQANATGLCRG